MTIEQIDLFPKEISELDCLWQNVVELKDSLRKTQKRLFGEIKELNERITELKAENERIKCKQQPENKRIRWIG